MLLASEIQALSEIRVHHNSRFVDKRATSLPPSAGAETKQRICSLVVQRAEESSDQRSWRMRAENLNRSVNPD